MTKTGNLMIAVMMMLGAGCDQAQIGSPEDTTATETTAVQNEENALIAGDVGQLCGRLNMDCCYSKTKGEYCLSTTLECQEGVCLKKTASCGVIGKPCCQMGTKCTQGACNDKLLLDGSDGDKCVACGDLGQIACDLYGGAETCNRYDLTPVNHFCVKTCGGNGMSCCNGATQCDAKLACGSDNKCAPRTTTSPCSHIGDKCCGKLATPDGEAYQYCIGFECVDGICQ